MNKITVRMLTESAVFIAVGTVLSMIKIDMPMGGGLTICSMLPLVIISHRWGWKWGVVTAFVYSVLQLMLGLDNVQYATSFIMALGIIFLDYIVAYTVIGLSGALEKTLGRTRNAVLAGVAVTFFLRFLCHFVTGAWIWDKLWPNEFGMTSLVYSAAYNGWYMAGELIITEVVVFFLYNPLAKFFRGEDIE